MSPGRQATPAKPAVACFTASVTKMPLYSMPASLKRGTSPIRSSMKRGFLAGSPRKQRLQGSEIGEMPDRLRLRR